MSQGTHKALGVGTCLGKTGWGHQGTATAIVIGVIIVILGKIASHGDWCSGSAVPRARHGLRKPGFRGNPVFWKVVPLGTAAVS